MDILFRLVSSGCSRFFRCSLLVFLLASTPGHATQRLPLLENWEFCAGESSCAPDAPSTGGAWRGVTLPHDWSIELPTDPDADTGGGGGYSPAGTGWYRKTFDAAEEWCDRDVAIYFEGVYRNAEVWLNGARIGEHAYGYTPFRFPISEHLRFDRPNELLVRVVNEPQPNSRWYTGSGIYRPVWLEVRSMLHFAPDSVFVTTTALSGDQATLDISAAVANGERLTGGERVNFTLLGRDGGEAASVSLPLEKPDTAAQIPLKARLTVSKPLSWTPETPRLYILRASLRRGGENLEQSDYEVGLRIVQWSSQRGFELNGRSIELLGGNVHHDLGPLGSAAYPAAEWRKVEILKHAGFNAVRTAHNPPSEAFLNACDRLGLLVMDEAFDAWKVAKTTYDYARIFDRNWEQDLRAMVLRDRNHPSVVMWSTGNEVYERGDDAGIARAHAMAAVVRQLDRSRPVTIGLNGLGENGDWTRLDGIFDALDVAGYNYALERHVEDHRRRPNRVIFASESYQTDAFANWAIASQNAYVIGDFVWSTLDYLGEAGIGRVFPPGEEARAHWIGAHYPWHAAYSGDIDLIGYRKPISHYRNIVWNRGETLYAAVLAPTSDGRPWNLTKWSVPPALATWTWPGSEGRKLTLEVYSRHPSVKVLLNGALIGEAPTTEIQAFKARFTVPYRPGRLEVVADSESFTLQTAGVPARLHFVEPDSQVPGKDDRLYFATMEIQDAHGIWCPDADRPIEFSVTGGGHILAVGSGDPASTESYRRNPRTSFQGRALVVVEVDPNAKSGVVLRAEADELRPAEIRIR